MSNDALYASPFDKVSEFIFDERVARVFSDMIGRSVPGYADIINMTSILTRNYYQNGSTCYDLGCSLGASALAMASAITDQKAIIYAIDNSMAMLDEARNNLQNTSLTTPVTFVCADIRDVDIQDASVVSMNFTLQFIPRKERFNLLSRIYNGLRTGGILILSEKLRFGDKQRHELLTKLHHDFKKANGYSDLEISQKRQALENVLVPESLEEHRSRLLACGFTQAEQWFQCFNFASLIAIKG